LATASTLFRFRIELSDIDRPFYGDLDLRVARHPSETELYLLTRVFAYALSYQDGLEFSPGLCTGDEPAIHALDSNGQISLWIDIGNPSARKLHKASKAARSVRVFTYRDPELLLQELASETIHRRGEIEIFSLGERFLTSLVPHLQRDNRWTVLHQEGLLSVVIGDANMQAPLTRHRLAN
jgi:uncharacterized protein YaeQ